MNFCAFFLNNPVYASTCDFAWITAWLCKYSEDKKIIIISNYSRNNKRDNICMWEQTILNSLIDTQFK